MANRTGPSRQRRVSTVDVQKIRDLAVKARDGDRKAVPPTRATDEAPEIGRRIAAALDGEMHDSKLDEAARQAARHNLVGLAAQGGAIYGRALLREGKIRISRRGDVFIVSSGYAIPSVIASNGAVAARANEGADESKGAAGEPVLPVSIYVQLDLMTWAQFHALVAAMNKRHAGLGAALTAFEEIAKLEALYPTLTVGAAMDAAGLDRDTVIPFVDLDDVLGDDAAAI